MKSTPATHIFALLLLGAPAASAMAATAPPSSNDQAAYEPAPVPDDDAYGPSAPAATGTRVSPGLYMPGNQFRGDGFSPGSSSQAYEERNFRPGPIMNFTMPLK